MPRMLPTEGRIPFFASAERRGVPARSMVFPTILCLALLLLVTTSGCESVGLGLLEPVTPGSGNIISQARDVEPFQEVRMASAANVVHVTATEAGCEIEADDNLLPLITTTVESGVLKIEYKGSVQPTQAVKIRLAGPPCVASHWRGRATSPPTKSTPSSSNSPFLERAMASCQDKRNSSRLKFLGQVKSQLPHWSLTRPPSRFPGQARPTCTPSQP